MILLLDQCVPRTSVEHLQDMSIQAVHCGSCGLSEADDTEILQYARDNGLVIVTLDSDFSHILALSGAASPTVIRVKGSECGSDGLGARSLERRGTANWVLSNGYGK